MGKKLFAPNGLLIVGTRVVLYASQGIENDDVAENDADGTYLFDDDGNGCDIDWDSQETVERDGERVFYDEDGEEWLESELVLRDDDSEEDEDDDDYQGSVTYTPPTF